MFLKKMELAEMLDKLSCFAKSAKSVENQSLYLKVMEDINKLIKADCEA